MSRNTSTINRHHRPQRSKRERQVEQTPIELFAAFPLLCGCWSNQPEHTCQAAPPPYCTCGATTGEGCCCPSPIGRVA